MLHELSWKENIVSKCNINIQSIVWFIFNLYIYSYYLQLQLFLQLKNKWEGDVFLKIQDLKYWFILGEDLKVDHDGHEKRTYEKYNRIKNCLAGSI